MPRLKKILHVGCGPNRQRHIKAGFNPHEWKEIRFDIDPAVEPDIIGTLTDMRKVGSGCVDAIFSSHNIEHLYPHEVPVALAEFLRVLNDDGFALITCPDLQSVCRLIAEGRLTDPAYNSPVGPITPLDILYGHRPQLAAGNMYMAHHCGFTRKSLQTALCSAGFKSVAARARPGAFDLWALASKKPRTEGRMRNLALEYFPEA
jgi:hypothetical protein